MIQIVNAQNCAEYASALDQHFVIRHNIYVGERRWMKLAKADGRERDEFDHEHAIYLLAMEGDTVVGGSRFVPSLKPHLLSDVFPLLAMQGVPRSPNIYEWTRMHVIKERREGRHRGRVMGGLFCGVLEYCLAEGVRSLTALVEMWWLPHFHEMGWRLRPLGMPELIEGEWSIAIMLEVSEDALGRTRAMYGIDGAVLRNRMIQSKKESRVLA